MDTKNMSKFVSFVPKSLVQSFMVVALIISAFFIGSLKTKVDFYEKGQALGTTNTAQPSAQQPTPAQPTITLDQIKKVFSQNVIKFGDAGKKLLLVEIADPSCPYCHVAGGVDPELNKQIGTQFTLVKDGGAYVAPVPEMKKLVDSGKAAFAYIYYPGHGNGEMGMKALLCANEKGKFWDVHDLLMSNAGYDLMNTKVKNDKTKSQDVADFLQPVFDSSAMKSCLDSGKYDGALQDDIKLATTLGVQGTPGFFVNTTVFAGAYNFKDMQSAVDAALK